MKKFAKFMFLALAACGVACTNNDGGGSDNNGNEGSEGNVQFEITVSGISSNSATVSVVPSSSDLSYYFDVVDKSNFENLDSSVALATDVIAYINASLAEGESFADYLSMGADSYTYNTSLKANTDYYAYAFGVSAEGVVTTDITMVPFKTLPSEGDDPEQGDEGVIKCLYADYEDYGDFYDSNARNWLIYMDDNTNNNIFYLEVQTSLSATSFVGEYPVAKSFAAGTAVYGYIDEEDYIYGSYWCATDSNDDIIDYNLLISGSITITRSGADYTVVVDAIGDTGATVKATYTGDIPEYQQSSSSSSFNRFSNTSRMKRQRVAKRPSRLGVKLNGVR